MRHRRKHTSVKIFSGFLREIILILFLLSEKESWLFVFFDLRCFCVLRKFRAFGFLKMKLGCFDFFLECFFEDLIKLFISDFALKGQFGSTGSFFFFV